MTGPGRAILRVALGALWLAAPAGAAAAPLEGALSVVDGDTIELGGQTIRLFGIDAPELGQACAIEGQIYDCGTVARSALLDLTAGATVICRVLPGQAGQGGSEGRLGRCFADGYDLSEGMAYTGWALAERELSERYAGFEDGAREARRGLWRGRFVAPWDWRGGARLPEEAAAR